MAQEIKGLVTEPDNLRSTSRAPMVEEAKGPSRSVTSTCCHISAQ